jgi:hypothetical protein
MDILFFRHAPVAVGQPDPPCPAFDTPEGEASPCKLFVVLHRDADPDAPTHDGFDYFAAQGSGDILTNWATENGYEVLNSEDLPNPISFLPEPFSSVTT